MLKAQREGCQGMILRIVESQKTGRRSVEGWLSRFDSFRLDAAATARLVEWREMSAKITSIANLRNDDWPGVATQPVAILLAFIFASTDHNRGNSNTPDLGQ